MTRTNQPSLFKGITYGLTFSLSSIAIAIAGGCLFADLGYEPPRWHLKGLEDQD